MKAKKTIVIPFTLPWDWSADFQRQTCLELAKKHHVYAYMQKDSICWLKTLSIQKLRYPQIKNITFYRPVNFLPLNRFKIIEYINHVIAYKLFEIIQMRKHQYILWIFDPEFFRLPYLSRCSTSLYDCVDYHAGFHSKSDKLVEIKKERILIKRVDYFFVNTKTLFRIHKKIRHAFVSEIGFRSEAFQNPVIVEKRFPHDKPIIGFVGAIDERINYTLLEKLIIRNPQWTFVLWGPIQADRIHSHSIQEHLKIIRGRPNAIFGRSKDPSTIPGVVKQFSVGVIPYDMHHDGVKYCFPMKLLEFLYFGKQVVSVPILEVVSFDHSIKIARTLRQWETQITCALASSYSAAECEKLKSLAIQNSWEVKINRILGVLTSN